MMGEAQLPLEQWPYALPAVNSAINNNVSAALGGLCPRTVFLGRPRVDPLAIIFNPTTGACTVMPPPPDLVRQCTETLMEDLADYRKTVSEVKHRHHIAKDLRVTPVHIQPGDYVMVARTGAQLRDKTRSIWEGPAVVLRNVDSEPLIFVIQDINTGYVVDHIAGHRVLNGKWQLLIVWQGDTEADDEPRQSWEPLEAMSRDVLTLVRRYARTLQGDPQEAFQQALAACGRE
jgi:hypothetical protein